MGLPKPEPVYTVDEYLAMERAAQERHAFLDGRVWAMAGESLAHGDITSNLTYEIVGQLKGTTCRALSKDTKVRSGPEPRGARQASGLFSYPDLVVVCGEPEFHDAYRDVILNPTAVVEVLSPSTEAFDRGEKFARYQQWNPTLRDYLLVAQDRAQVEHYSRRDDGSWSYRLVLGLDQSVTLDSVRCTLKLKDVYDRVTLPLAGTKSTKGTRGGKRRGQ